MRELKFRAWHPENKIMVIFDGKALKDRFIAQHFALLMCGEHPYSASPLMQYTGLKDNLGNPIFEGDILRVSNDDYHETADYEVVFCSDDGYPAFDLKGFISDSNSFSEVINSGLYYYVVAGNIHENKELLQ